MFLCYDYTRGFPVCQPPNAKKKTIAKPRLPSFLLLHAVEFVLYGLLFFFECRAFLLLTGEALAAGKHGKQDGFMRIYWQGIREEAQEIASKNTAHGGRAAGATVTAVTALALAIAESKSQEELALLAAVLTQPGDTLNTIAAHNELRKTER